MSVDIRKPCSVGLVSLCAVVGALALTAAPALATVSPTVTVKPVGTVTSTTANLSGTVNPNGGPMTVWDFQYAKDSETEGWTPSALAGPALASEEVEGTLEGLEPNTAYEVRLVATNEEGGEGVSAEPNPSFTTPPAAPKIESESSTVIDATEARLEATINPGNSETTYHFEYGPSAGSYDVSVPGVSGHIPAGLATKSVNAAAIGLAPGTTYHYRVVASNALPGEVDGPDQTFTTPVAQGTSSPSSCTNERLRAEQPFGLTLPDCRAYEMVSPPNTNGNDAVAFGAQSAARASEAKLEEPAITYSAKGSYGSPGGALTENQYVSRRAPGGWGTQAVTPLSSTGETGATEGHESSYPTEYFTPELTAGLAITSAQLGEAPPLDANYGIYLAQFSNSTYRYVGQTAGAGANLGAPWGASSDLERVVLTNPENGHLFEWVNGQDVPVSVIDAGEEEVAASAGSGQYFLKEKDAWHATSEDGSRVYFTTPPEVGSGVGQLYVRVNIDQPHTGKEQSELNANEECTEPAKACTIKVSAGTASARYWGASANGEKAFYTENEDLYEYSLPLGQVTGGQTTALTAGAKVQGVAQVSEEGSYVYFVANGVLTNTANARGEHAEPGSCGEPEGKGVSCNLYLAHDGETTFIAMLSAGLDKTDWLNGNPTESGPEINTAVVTPKGTQLAFISERSLTGYDNEQAEPGTGECKSENSENHEVESGMCREVYLYDAGSESHPPTLVCASCNPTGARPIGPSSIPGVVPRDQDFADYRPRDLLASGTLFFDSKDELVPHASDGRQNVYEYEDGEAHAISDVAGGYESFFLDASPSGENVFFASADKLLPEDPGGNTVVWDAREGGGFPVVTSPASCGNADSCKAPESAQPSAFAPTGSATFNGLGNVPGGREPNPPVLKPAVKPKALTRAQKLAKALKVCAKDKQKSKRAKCQKQAQQKYGASKAKKAAHTNRRGKR